MYICHVINHSGLIQKKPSPPRHHVEISKSMVISANSQSKITTEKGPVMLLYELFSDISFNCTQTVGPQHAKFKTLVTVNGCQQFEGTGMDFLFHCVVHAHTIHE